MAVGAVLDASAKPFHALLQSVTLHVDGSGAGSSGRIVANFLTVYNADLTIAVDQPLDDPVYVLADYGMLMGSFNNVLGVPAGYDIDYWYHGGTQIALVSSANADYNQWARGFPGFYDTDPGHDPDGDGVTNKEEYAYGLDPTQGSSSSWVVSPLNRQTREFSYTRRDPALTGFTYTVWISTDGQTWMPDYGAMQMPGDPLLNRVETRTITLSWNPNPIYYYTVTLDDAAAPGAILNFGMRGNPASISGGNIDLTVPAGTDVTTLAPIFLASPGAICDHVSGNSYDFTNPVSYTMVSQDASTTRRYTVRVTVSDQPTSSAKDMLTFDFGTLGPARISGNTISVTVPLGTDLTTMVPVLTVSPLAWASPPSGVARDFSTPQTYTVTAQDGSTRDYTVTV